MKTEKLTKPKLVAEMRALAAQYDSRSGNKSNRSSTEQQSFNKGSKPQGRIYPNDAFDYESRMFGGTLVD